jgi:hypothetical protein
LQNIFKLVFSNYTYIFISAIIFLVLFFPLSIISEHLFLEPYVIFSIYSDTAFNFSLILILSVIAGIVVSMNIFRIKLIKKVKKIGTSITGTVVGASAGACSCGPIGFSVITTFGTSGSIASSFLTNYEIPLRLISIGILFLVLLTTMRSLSTECKIN